VHELAICGSIAEIVKRRAADRPVAAIYLRIGRLRQVVPETLVYCWDLVSTDTELDGAALEVEDVPARIACKACGATSVLDDLPLFLCSVCGGVDLDVVSGEEFVITAIDLVEA
jgi:hydrogenase nickel incorporation protein HypA/HybF